MSEPIISIKPYKKAALLPNFFSGLALLAPASALFLLGLAPAVLALYSGIYLPFAFFRAGFLLTVFAWIFFSWKYIDSYRYDFYPDRIETKKGVLSLEEKSVRYSEITNINKWEGLYDRALGTATIEIHTAGEDGRMVERGIIDTQKRVKPEISLKYIDEHEQLYEILKSRINDPESDSGQEIGTESVELKPNLAAAFIPKILGGVFVGSIAYFIGVYRYDLSINLALGMAVFSSLGSAFMRLMNMNARSYKLTEDEIEIREGFLNVTHDTVSYDRVTDIRFEKPVLQRIFNTGTIRVNTAGSDIREFKISYIDDPEQMHQKLSEITSQTRYKPNH